MNGITLIPDRDYTFNINYSSELLWALQQEPEQFEAEARILLAVKLYESNRLTTGLAAQLAGVPRSAFIFLLGQYSVSPFGQDPDELANDLSNARWASHPQ